MRDNELEYGPEWEWIGTIAGLIVGAVVFIGWLFMMRAIVHFIFF